MQTEITITVSADDEKNESLIAKKIKNELKKTSIKSFKNMSQILIKKSIDARHGTIKIHLKYKVYIGEIPEDYKTNFLPQWKNSDSGISVLIIGSGPAGLFAAFKLLEYGIKPVIIERGVQTDLRRQDIAKISTKGFVDENSNYCFGEGGAGTFSDGKLYTRSNKRGNIQQILQIFAHFGADKNILTQAHPHIGTDQLPKIINLMREKIIGFGGEFYFNCKAVNFITKKTDTDSENNYEIIGIETENTKTGIKNKFYANAVILAAGHSAFDIYTLLAKKFPSSLEQKTFAIGVRIEHPRHVIDSIQFHGKTENMEAAEYRLNCQVQERGVYSFCMCPGGFVVPSATENDGIAVNGMSCAKRNSKWSNSAIVVETRPEDIPENFIQEAEELGSNALAGLCYRKHIEQLTKQNGKNQSAPSQKIEDFINSKQSENLPPTSYTAGIVPSRLDMWLPEQIVSRLKEAFKTFDKKMHGFISNEAILIASETRTSTPVRILRNKESLECVAVKNLYPAGEGSGYSGGIVSSAMDGQNSAKKAAEKLLKQNNKNKVFF